MAKKESDKDKQKDKPKSKPAAHGGPGPGEEGKEGETRRRRGRREGESRGRREGEAQGPHRAPGRPSTQILKKFHGKFLPRGPLRDRLKALMQRWDSGEDHGGVTVEELKSLHEDWKADRAKAGADRSRARDERFADGSSRRRPANRSHGSRR